MALAIDASTPAIATSSSTTVATLTSNSFTPPAGSVLLIEWVGNSHTGVNPTTPGITDNLGAHLAYTLIDWQSRNDSPTVDGQAATWWANVGTSAAMTITTTNNVTGGNLELQQALRIVVLTGADTTTPIGAHGKAGSASAALIAQNYTAQATGGWGFISAADWDALPAMSAGTGCTLDGSAVIPTNQLTYGFLRRTSADDTSGSTNTLNVTIGGTSTHLNWVYVEVQPAGGSRPRRERLFPPTRWRPGMPPYLRPRRRFVETATGGAIINGTADLTGAGTVTDVPAVQAAPATPTGAGAVSASGVIAGSATLTGAGTLAATVTQGSGSTPAGAGTLAVAVIESATVTAAGAGALTATVTEGATTSLSGAGTLSSPVVQRVIATLTGAGTLTAQAGAGAIQGVASLTAAGTLTATATQAATATAGGDGVLSAKATQGTIVTLTGTGALTGSVVQGAVAALAGAGIIDATGTGATHNATSAATITAAHTSTDTVVAGRTSAAGLSAGRTSASGVSATRTSTSSTTAGRSSTPDVSDG